MPVAELDVNVSFDTEIVAAAGVGFTTMVIPVLVAVKGLAQAALDVIIQVTTSPFAKEDVVNVVPPVPAFTPFTCHW